MSNASPWVQRSLAGLAVAVLVAGIVAIAVHHDTGSGANSTVAAVSPTTTAPEFSSGSPLPTGPAATPSVTPTTQGKGPTAGASTTTAAPAAVRQVPGTPANPGLTAAPRPGSYFYNESIQSSEGTSNSTLTEKISGEASPPGETRQAVDDSDSSSQSANAHSEVSWRSNGLYLLSQTFTVAGGSYNCAWSPSIRELIRPLAAGSRWAFQSSCVVTIFGRAINLKLTGSADVSGTERLQVGSSVVDVWVIDSTIDVNGSGAYTFSLHQVSKHRFAPRQGLEVVESSTNTMTSAQGTSTTMEQRQLRSLQPQ
jgi:hypothetical protein